MTKCIGILGCGWLGLPLAQCFLKSGNLVRGTVRSTDKLIDLQRKGITAFEINLLPEKLYGDLQGFLEGLDVLIIDIPPNTRKDKSYDFAHSIKLLMTFVEVYHIDHVLFISSTSVFEDEESIPVYNENVPPNATSYSGKQLIAAEQWVAQKSIKYTIIRPGGLIGEDRHPIKYLAGKTGVKNPEAPVNMVSRDYLIILITAIIQQEQPPKIVHAISEEHNSREEYYLQAAKERELNPPKFDFSEKGVGKKVVSIYDYAG